jgi:hypothetical protein
MVKAIRRSLLIIAASIVFVPWPAFAVQGLTSVIEVQAYPSGTAARFGAFPSHACGSGTFKVAGVTPNANERAMHATLMAALISGKQVWITSTGCDGPLEIIMFVGLYQ